MYSVILSCVSEACATENTGKKLLHHICTEETFAQDSEAFASEFLANFEETLPR